MQNYFVFFQIPQCFTIDLVALENAYHTVQTKIHPDKFIQTTKIEKDIAIKRAIQANTAYQILKNPLKRAIHLCELNGVNLQDLLITTPSDFLIQQMNWYETLDNAKITKNFSELKQLKNELNNTYKDIISTVEMLFNTQSFLKAQQQVQQLMFLEKLTSEINCILYDT